MDAVLCIIMAGGEGRRLSVLSWRRAKPAVPFGGSYRIIDFPLSNIMHSGLRHVGIVTQYRPYSLIDHVGLGEAWGLAGFGQRVHFLSPHTGPGEASFYNGTADAIYRNIEFIERHPEVEHVLILSGDHIYRMDYRSMLDYHRSVDADLTIATQTVPWEETHRFGLMVASGTGRIRQFQEKPKSNPLSNNASLGIYAFRRSALIQALCDDHADPASDHDFGGNIIPRLIADAQSYHFPFEHYWRDVGTIKSYIDAHRDALAPHTSGLDLAAWDVRTNPQQSPLHWQGPARFEGSHRVSRSLVSRGAHIAGEVVDSVVSPGVRIGRGASVRGCLLLAGACVENDTLLQNVIVDKHARIGARVIIGAPDSFQPNIDFPDLLHDGITLVGKHARIDDDARIGANCIVFPDAHVPAEGTAARHGRTFYARPGPA